MDDSVISTVGRALVLCGEALPAANAVPRRAKTGWSTVISRHVRWRKRIGNEVTVPGYAGPVAHSSRYCGMRGVAMIEGEKSFICGVVSDEVTRTAIDHREPTLC